MAGNAAIYMISFLILLITLFLLTHLSAKMV